MEDSLFDKKITCPVCETKYTTKNIKSAKIKVIKRHPDFFVEYKDLNPIFYEVNVCSRCGYSGFANIYDEISEYDKNKVKELITVKWNSKKDFACSRNIDDALASYKLALLTYNALDYRKSILAKVALRLSWIYRIKEDPLEQKFLEFSAKYYEAAYSTEKFESDNEEILVLYMISELNKKIKNYEKSVSYFTTLLAHEKIKEFKNIEVMARDEWQEIRELMKKEKAKK